MLLEDEEYEFEQLILPAILDKGADKERALWPQKHSLERLLAMKNKNSYMFAGQMQQNRSPLGGGILKGAWFGRYDVLPPLKYRILTVDTANKTKEHNDYSVAQCWGLGTNGNLYLIDQIRGKWEAHELETVIPDFWNKHKAQDGALGMGKLRRMYVEDAASGTGLFRRLKRIRLAKAQSLLNPSLVIRISSHPVWIFRVMSSPDMYSCQTANLSCRNLWTRPRNSRQMIRTFMTTNWIRSLMPCY